MNNPTHKESKDLYEAAIALASSGNIAGDLDVQLIGRVIKELPEWPTIVQLGAGSNTLALAVFAYDRNATLFSMDTKEDGHHYEMQALKNVGININNGCYFHVISDSAEAGKQWYDGKVDMVIVNATRDYEGVKDDIEAWLPHVNGFFFMHLYNAQDVPKHYPGVKEACDELLGSKPLWGQGWSAVFDRTSEGQA